MQPFIDPVLDRFACREILVVDIILHLGTHPQLHTAFFLFAGRHRLAVASAAPNITNVVPAVLLTTRPPRSDVSQLFARPAKNA